MKNNKKYITKLFYKFLVENGILFEFLELLGQTRHKTLEVYCMKSKVSRYITNVVTWKIIGSKEDKHLQIQLVNEKWQKYITNYLNNKK